jgi:chromosome partitioning protein
MRYAVWNNKGGVGKSFLSFVLSAEIANNTKRPVLAVDMCPQANLSEIVLGGNGAGADRLEILIRERKTVGGYFDSRIESPHGKTGKEEEYLVQARPYNQNLPPNLWLLAGDPSLELQAQVINQIGGQALPVEAWKNVHNWLKDLVQSCSRKLGEDATTVFIDCNPSFSAYTELAMIASDQVIIPCSSDGSSARAIDNVGALLYGIASGKDYGAAGFSAKAHQFGMDLPKIRTVLLNRSTQYNERASKAFKAMFDEIKRRTDALKAKSPQYFDNDHFSTFDVPDSHSVAIVCSHLGMPLYQVEPGKYGVHETTPQVNSEPLDRYKSAVAALVQALS